MSTFKEYSLSPEVQKAIEEMGFVTPSEIQSKAIPLLLSHHGDFVGQAQTGTGKTAAFGIPLIEKIDPSAKTVQAIILFPTRNFCKRNRVFGFLWYVKTLRGNTLDTLRKLYVIRIFFHILCQFTNTAQNLRPP
ncbi:MAG TPA: DEAD/DEAH box helicase, partial [bacterium]|nr:DEAD/DEAH box helicase [bacterium]